MNEEQSKEINIKNTKKYIIKEIKTFKIEIGNISKISKFPSGNIIIITSNQTINIFDKDLKFKQTLNNEDNSPIIGITIKDDNNFLTWTNDKIITTWKKYLDLFKINEIILNAHNFEIYEVIYSKNDNIISIDRNSIKLWSKSKSSLQCTTIIKSNYFYSLLLFEDKNMLICSGDNGIWFFDIITFSLYFEIKEKQLISSSLFKLNNNTILFDTGNNFIIFSLLEKKVIKSFNHDYLYFNIVKLIPQKRIMICGRYNSYSDFVFYNIDNFQIVYRIIDDVYLYEEIENLNDDSIMLCTREGTFFIFKLLLL